MLPPDEADAAPLEPLPPLDVLPALEPLPPLELLPPLEPLPPTELLPPTDVAPVAEEPPMLPPELACTADDPPAVLVAPAPLEDVTTWEVEDMEDVAGRDVATEVPTCPLEDPPAEDVAVPEDTVDVPVPLLPELLPLPPEACIWLPLDTVEPEEEEVVSCSSVPEELVHARGNTTTATSMALAITGRRVMGLLGGLAVLAH